MPLSGLATVLVAKWMRLKLCGLLFKIIFNAFAVKVELGLSPSPMSKTAIKVLLE